MASAQPVSDFQLQGPLRVLDVLERPLFRSARLVAGRAGLQRMVKWVHILEVADARPFINGGELVLTTGTGVRDSEASFVSYVHQLIEGNAAALCVELGTSLASIPQAAVELAEQMQFPLIVFPHRVRFVDMTQDLHKLIFMQERQIYQEQEWVERLVRGEGSEDGGPAGTGRLPKRCRAVWIRRIDGMEWEEAQSLEDWLNRRRELALLVRAAFAQHRLRAHLSVRPDSVIALWETDCSSAGWLQRIEHALSHLRAAFR
ncbi:MAG: PucR family transcriptional regulator ligand-binding domain-containing protein, partial [Alicyclobacillus sp.]|nr:PucR family transcriptional regulator ligand-binding domain-containing protein [Alicyclobacillus sp.]